MTEKNFEEPALQELATRFDRTRRGRRRRSPTPTRSRTDPRRLTVDDILGAAQNTDAAAEDAVPPTSSRPCSIDLKRAAGRVRQLPSPHRGAARARDRAGQGRGRQGPAAGARRPRPRREARRSRRGQPAFAAIGDKVRARRRAARRRRPTAPSGELFDPQQHEAIFQAPTPGVTEADDPRGRRGRLPPGRGRAATGQGRRRGAGRVSREGHRMASQDWFDKDFYKVLGVDKERQRSRSEEDLPQARAQVPPRLQSGRCRRRRRSSRRSARRTRCSPTPSSARSTTRSAPWARGRALHRGRPARRLRGRVQHVRPGPRRGSQSPQDFDDIFSMFNQHGRRLRLRPVRAALRRIPRLRRPAARRRRDRPHHDRLRHRHQGRDHHLQGEDGKPFKVKIPAGVADGQKIRLRGRGRPSPDGGETGDIVVQVDGAPASGVHPRRAQPARDRAGDLHRGGARRHDRGADARRRPRQAAGRPGHAVRTRAAREGPRGARRRRAPATCWPRCRSRCRRTSTTRRARRCERFHELEPKDNPRADLMVEARRGLDASHVASTGCEEVRTDAGTRDG